MVNTLSDTVQNYLTDRQRRIADSARGDFVRSSPMLPRR
jgi:hypothetical protein